MSITELYSKRSQIDTYDLDRIPPSKDLDVSYIKCYPSWLEGEDNPWKDLNFVNDPVLLVMGVGYRHPKDSRKYADTEFKPDYNEVINWVE